MKCDYTERLNVNYAGVPTNSKYNICSLSHLPLIPTVSLLGPFLSELLQLLLGLPATISPVAQEQSSLRP